MKHTPGSFFLPMSGKTSAGRKVRERAKEEMFYDRITEFVFAENEPQKSDIIFIPGSKAQETVRKAASLFHEGWAPFLLPSGRWAKHIGHFEGEYETEWEFMKALLLELGVPEGSILKEDQATFTWENAIYSRKLLDRLEIPVKRAILCCKNFHAARALAYYQQQFPETEFLVCPAQAEGITRENWYLDQEKTKVVLGELKRCGEQFGCMLPEGEPIGFFGES